MEGPAARAYLLSRICEEFHCTPSQAEQEFIGDVLEIMDVRQYQRAKALIEDEESNEETIQKSGVPEVFIQRVFDNIERSQGDGVASG